MHARRNIEHGWRRPGAVALLLLIALLALTCAKNPVTGKREFVLVSEAQEIRMGAESDPAIVAQYGLVDDPELQAYVNELGQRMVAVSHRPQLEFHFRLLDDPIVNAFALPGGYVYLTRGILGYLTDEAAMAGVLGHEIGHVTARHGVQQATQQQLFGLGLGVGSAVSSTFAQFSGLAGNAAGLLLLRFGRDDETQSDRLGVEYATRLGYDTHHMAEFFHTLDVMSEQASGSLPTWQSTHPDPGDRFTRVNALTDEWQARPEITAGSFQTARDRYLDMIDGIVFGTNPRHGYVKDDEFVHPDLAFRFPIPAGWRSQNTPRQVVIANEQGNAATIFTLESEATSPGEAASAFVAETGAQVESQHTLQIHGHAAARVVGTVPQQSGSLPIVATWIQKDDTVFVFYGLGAESAAHTRIANGFDNLTDPEALNVQPVTIDMVPAPRGGTFRSVIADFPVPEGADLDADGLALLNGLDADDHIEEGWRIKVLATGAP